MVRWRLSRSSAATRWPEAASATAVWTAVVDLPVPPFSLAKMMKCGPLMSLDLFPGHAAMRRYEKCIGGAAPVQIIRRLEELQPALAELRRGGEKNALGLTMGALSPGHI